MNPITEGLIKAFGMLANQQHRQPKKKFRHRLIGVALHLAQSRTTLTAAERVLANANGRHLLPPRKINQVNVFYQERIEDNRYDGESLRMIRARTNTQEAARRLKRMSHA